MGRSKLSVEERAKRAEAYMTNGHTVVRACKLAMITPGQFYIWRKAKAVPAPEHGVVATVPAEQPARTLVGRLLKSNLSADDKLAILQAAYN